MDLRTMMWINYFKAFWHGFFHPWQTEAQRQEYAVKSLRKLDAWFEEHSEF